MANDMNQLNSDQTATYEGTCQSCFGTFVVRHSDRHQWHVVKHGYKRPGDGYTVGACYGEFEAPYELSKALVEVNLIQRKSDVVAMACRIEDLIADKVDVLMVEIYRPNRTRDQTRTMMVKMVPGDVVEGWGFQHYRKIQQSTAERQLKFRYDSVVFLTAKIASWTLAPQKLADHEKAEAGRLAVDEEKRAHKKAMKAYKNFFVGLKDVVTAHRDATKALDEAKANVWGVDEVRHANSIANAEFNLARFGGPMVRVKAKKAKKAKK